MGLGREVAASPGFTSGGTVGRRQHCVGDATSGDGSVWWHVGGRGGSRRGSKATTRRGQRRGGGSRGVLMEELGFGMRVRVRDAIPYIRS